MSGVVDNIYYIIICTYILNKCTAVYLFVAVEIIYA